MQETKATDTSSGGFLKEVRFPRSKIYVSTRSKSRKKKYRFKSKEGSFHFFLRLDAGKNYDQETVLKCRGKYRCLNCSRAIQEAIYFYPIEYTKKAEFVCDPAPHCRSSCALRSAMDTKNNFDLNSIFYLMYGANVVCAPPRRLLYLPGGPSVEEYHKMIDDSMVVNEETKQLRSFIAPVYFSCTFLKNHQLVPDVTSLIEEVTLDTKISVGPSRSRDDSDLTVVELPSRDPFKTRLSETFSIDPASYRQPK